MKTFLTLLLSILLVSVELHSEETNSFMRLNGPYGGQPTCMAPNQFTEESSPTLYAGSTISGLFVKRADVWETINDSNLKGSIRMLTVNSRKEVFTSVLNKGLFYSTDDGISWTKLMSFNPYIYATSICCLGPDRILSTMSDNNFLISDDKGLSWNLAAPKDTIVYTKMIHYRDSIVLAGTSKFGVFISNDYGTSFKMLDTFGFRSKNVRDLLITKNGIMFAATAKGLYRSDNLGISWVELNNGIYVEDSRYLYQLNDSTIFLATSIGLYYTTDIGDSWTEVDKKTDIVGVNALVKTENDEVIVSGAYGIFKSIERWTKYEEIDNGFNNLSLSKILVFNSQSKEYILTSTANKVLYQTDDPSSSVWNVRFRGITYITFSQSPWGDIFCTSGMGGILRTKDYGETFEQFYTNNSRGIESFTYDSKRNLFAALSLGAVKSTDNGELWDLYNNGVANRKGICITLDSKDNLYLLTSDSGLFKTISNQNDWQRVNIASNIPQMKSIIISKNDDVYIVSDSIGIFKTNTLFTKIDHVFKKNRLKRVILNRSDQLIAATAKRIYLSNDKGMTWDSTTFAWNSPNSNIIDMSLNNHNRLYVIDDLGISSSINVSDIKPSPISANNSIYPNPANDKLYIESDQLSGDIEYIILNLNGEEISRGCYSSGNGIDINHLSDGVYFLSIRINSNHVTTEKFEILK